MEQVRRLKKGIADSIGHVVCYGKLGGQGFLVSDYVRECQSLFSILGVPDQHTRHILLHGIVKGLREYEMLQGELGGLAGVIRNSSLNNEHAAAQLHPSLSPMMALVEELGFLCEELEVAIAQ